MSKPTMLSIALLLVLGSSIILNILLFSRAKQYYRELNQTRLDPLGLNDHPIDAQPVTNTKQTRVVFFGDSRAASWIAPNLNQYEFINRGIGSQTSVQTLQRFTYHVSSLKPKIIIIQVGVNDLKTIPLFPERRNAIVANCQGSIKRIVEESRKLGAVVIVTTIFPVGEVPLERKVFWSDDISRAIKEVNAYIATLAEEKTIVFDTFPILGDSQGMILPKYRRDE
ncbi:GDSL-type esterase/lipase family protein, partial [Microcoleus sp. bin38.metabat.b11b12b14.051]|uniref:SGNH/GDSL hydrolase family protein n=1 Tax=Microcoleus sp. bin38.metabat.b11b12b14.051 TaxID=2742709 RepID=UPI0025F171E7